MQREHISIPKLIAYVLFSVIIFALQTGTFGGMRIFGSAVDLLPALVTAAALLGGEDTEALYARFRNLQTAALHSLSDAVPAADADEAVLRETALRLSLHSAAERLLAEAIIAALPAADGDAAAKKQKKAK